MQKLFFELLQVALGSLDCVDRAPLEEEWPELYRMAREQGVAGTCYQGVEKLFEFGLRGPQELMLDWMAESEETFDADVIEHYYPIPMKGILKNRLWQTFLNDNRKTEDNNTMQLFYLLVHIHETFCHERLTLRLLLDAYRMMKQLDGKWDAFASGKTPEEQLRALGLLKFTRGVMWVIEDTMKLERKLMPCEPSEELGRFILSDIMGEPQGWRQRLKKWWL